MNAELGQVIDSKYKLVRLLGSGGMGAVYEGENLRIRRRVAIKMLHAGVSSQAETVTRFEREAQAAGTIGSEHICEVLDLGVLGDGTRYMVMEYLDGETLGARIKRFGRLTPLQSVPLLVQVLDGLAAAHAAGIIHRDLKPDNVWIVPQRSGMKDFVKILDFGVSKFAQGGSGEEMNMTRAGAVVGTPYYMSPEQARGMHQIDQRTDIYALGVVLYQATTGQVPYQAETFNELLFKIVLEVAPPPQTYVPNLDPDFAAIITRAMAREPAQRYGTCAEFRDALVAYQTMRSAGPGALPAPRTPPSRPNQGIGGTRVIDMSAMTGPAPAPLPMPPGPPMPWANASSSGAGPAVAFAPMPQLGQTGPGMVAGPPTATANSWGNASSSGAGAAAPPKSKAGIVIGVAAATLIVGGGIAAAVVFGRPGLVTAPAAPAESAATAPAKVNPPAPSPAPAAPTASATAAATAAPTAATTAAASAEASAPSAAPGADDGKLGIPGLRGGNGNKFGRGKPAPAPPAPPASKPPAPKPAGGNGDLGY